MIAFRPAVRSNVILLIGLAGASGSGKTFTAMRLASGMSDGKRFAVIDTENGRASHYADQFAFDVAELHEPFTPAAYADAIGAADKAGYGVIVVDSMSHEYAGYGGVLDMQEAEFTRMGGRESVKVASWIKPKGEHKKMMQRLLQTRAHLILCFRADAKIEIVKGDDGRTKIIPKRSLVGLDGWIPITEKSVPFELTVSLMLTPDKPGIPQPIKLQEQHRALFPLDKPITEESGRRIKEWAAGGAANRAPGAPNSDGVPGAAANGAGNRAADVGSGASTDPLGGGTSSATSVYITPEQVATLETMATSAGVPLAGLYKAAGVERLTMILASNHDRARKWLDTAIENRKEK